MWALLRRYRALPAAVRRWVPYWLLSAGVFCTAALLGAVIGTQKADPVLFPIRSAGTPAPTPGAGELFLHNVRVALLSAFGSLTMGLLTVWILGFNGFALGGVVADASGEFGLLWTLALLVPHGVIELPAIWLAGAIGFRWTHVIWAVATGRSQATSLPRVVVRSLGVLVLVVLALAVAAVIEATVTVALAGG